MEPTNTEQTGQTGSRFGTTLLTPERRVIALELALDTLTVRIADQENLVVPNQRHIKLLQDQVRLIASQIRSYEKLEALKKSLGLKGAALQQKPAELASEEKTALEETAGLSRAARRRLKRLEAKQAKKNKLASMNGGAAAALPGDLLTDGPAAR